MRIQGLYPVTLARSEVSTDTLSRSIGDVMVIPDFRMFGVVVSIFDKVVMGLPDNPSQLRTFLRQRNIRVNNSMIKGNAFMKKRCM